MEAKLNANIYWRKISLLHWRFWFQLKAVGSSVSELNFYFEIIFYHNNVIVSFQLQSSVTVTDFYRHQTRTVRLVYQPVSPLV